MINKKISNSKRVNDMPLQAQLLFTWLIPHLDCNGCFYGNAQMIKSLVIPRKNWSKKMIEKWLTVMENSISDDGTPLIYRYTVNTEQYLFMPGFVGEQIGLRRDKEKPEFPTFDGKNTEKIGQTVPLRGREGEVEVKDKVLPPKGGQRKAQSNTTKEKKDSVINEIFSEMRRFLGYPEDKVCGPGSPTPGEKKEAKVCGGEAVPAIEESSAGDARSKREKGAVDPIPNYGREGKAIKRMLTRGFTREAIVECWKGKVSQRGGEFVSMTWVNEDIGKTEKQKRRPRELSTEAEIAASIKEVAL